jgi:thiol:disulfide interchange protein
MTLSASVNALEWRTDYEQAIKDAERTGRFIVLNFTGSDWCAWCKIMDKQIFQQPDFEKFVTEYAIPVEIDFPRRLEQSPKVKARNAELKTKHKVRGFPTVVLLHANGRWAGAAKYQLQTADAIIQDWMKTIGSLHFRNVRPPVEEAEPVEDAPVEDAPVGNATPEPEAVPDAL